MEGEDQGDVPGLELDLKDIMDVITTYKCKFCSFTCQQAQGIASHVRHVHLKSSPDKKQIAQESKSQTSPSDIESNQQSLTSTENVKSPEIIAVTETYASSYCSPLPDSSRPSTSPDGLGQDESSKNTHLSQTPVDGFGQQVEQPYSAPELSPGSPASSLKTVDSAVDVIEVAEVAEVPQMRETRTVAAGNEGINEPSSYHQTITAAALSSKELYLCGQCNLGFTNIVDCKEHMIKDHNISITDTCDSEEEVSSGPNRVSVGTQVTRGKRPGRKKKTKEDVEVVEPAPDDERMEDWEDAENNLYETSNKRKSRPPRRLTQLYYLDKKNKPSPKKPKLDVEPARIKCPKKQCHAKFRSSTALDIHLGCHTVQPDADFDTFTCTSCSEVFAHWKVLRMHLWREHSIDTDLLKCEYCDFRTDLLHKLEHHTEVHSDTRPYVCETCDKSFKQYSQLKNHQVIHADRSVHTNKWYSSKQCQICNRRFANEKCLQKHVQAVHDKLRPFKCPYCTHTTARKAMMELHIRTHTGEKPFTCDQCSYTTGDHNSMRRHRMRHTGQKPYKCQYCPYACIQTISLKTHMKNKHPGSQGLFQCTLCQYQSVSELNFKNHMEDHKNGLITAAPSPAPKTSILPANKKAKTDTSQQPQQQQQVATAVAPLGTLNLSKVASVEHLVPAGTNTAQMIYSALNAISQPGGMVTAQQFVVEDGSHAEPQTSLVATDQDGNVTHTITFHIPATEQQSLITTEDGQMVVAVESDNIAHTQTTHSSASDVSQVALAVEPAGAVPPQTQGNISSQNQLVLTVDSPATLSQHQAQGSIVGNNQLVLVDSSHDVQGQTSSAVSETQMEIADQSEGQLQVSQVNVIDQSEGQLQVSQVLNQQVVPVGQTGETNQ